MLRHFPVRFCQGVHRSTVNHCTQHAGLLANGLTDERAGRAIWGARPDGAVGLLHLELQTRVDPDLGERLAEYALRLWRRDHLPVRSVVVLLRETRQAPGMPFRLDWGDAEVLRFSFDVVRLWELPQALVLGRPEPAPLPLATLMAGATVATVEDIAGRLARAPELAAAGAGPA